MAARIVLLIWVVFLTNLRLSLCGKCFNAQKEISYCDEFKLAFRVLLYQTHAFWCMPIEARLECCEYFSKNATFLLIYGLFREGKVDFSKNIVMDHLCGKINLNSKGGIKTAEAPFHQFCIIIFNTFEMLVGRRRYGT